MKKLFLSLIVCAFCTMAYSQDWTPNKRGITCEFTIDCPGVKASTAYSRVLEYIDQTYVDANSVTKNADNANNTVIVSGYYPNVGVTKKVTDWGIVPLIPLGTHEVEAHHHIKFLCCDDQVKVRLNVDFYEIFRGYSSDLKVKSQLVQPFGKLTEVDHKKYKLINKAFNSDTNIFDGLNRCVNEDMKNLSEILNDEF